MRWRFEDGIPQLTFDQLSICSQQFASLVARIADVCLYHRHPALRIPDRQCTPDELVKLAQSAFETWDMPTKPSKDELDTKQRSLGSLTASTVGYALAAYLQRASEAISPALDLSLWTCGYCTAWRSKKMGGNIINLQKIEHKVYPQVERLFTVDLDLAIGPSIPTQ